MPDAPVMPVGGFAVSAAPAQEEEEATPKAVKTSFTVIFSLMNRIAQYVSPVCINILQSYFISL